MPAIGGFFGWNEPPPAAITTALASNAVPASVATRNSGASGVPITSSDATISPKWNCGEKGFDCSSRLSTSCWPVTMGKPGMS